MLVLGEGTPLRISGEELTGGKQRCLALLKTIAPRWRGEAEWSRWTTMAMHFASFYLDLALSRDVTGVAAEATPTEGSSFAGAGDGERGSDRCLVGLRDGGS